MEDDLRRINRLHKRYAADPNETRRVDPARLADPPAKNLKTFGFRWLIVCCGAASLAFGLALMALALFDNRSDLWRPGLASAVVGHFAFLAGLFLHLDARRRQEAEQSPTLQQPRDDADTCQPPWSAITQWVTTAEWPDRRPA